MFTAPTLRKSPPAPLAGAHELSPRYRVWLCDVWGVVHDGLKAFPTAVDALRRHRATGGVVVLITNAPRPSVAVRPQLARLGVGADAYNAVCTSGDATRALVRQHAERPIFYLGPERDRSLLDGLTVELAPLERAGAVLCTGLFDDDTERPEDYDPLLAAMRARNLDFICANPDKVVRRGDRLLPCAGALADRYEALGGNVLMAGKPYRPIYDTCLELAAQALGRAVERGDTLAIGDGLPTDVEGAARCGLPMLFIAGGIHEEELGDGDLAAAVLRQAPELDLVGTLPMLRW